MCTTLANVAHDSGDDDDIWADSSDDGRPGGDQRELDREAAARHRQFYNAGYREAIEEGKEQTLQQGFDLGYSEGASAGFEWGFLRGAVLTLAALDGQAAGTRNLHDQIQALKTAADVPPRDAMLAIFRQILSTPMPTQHAPAHQQQKQQQQRDEAQHDAGGQTGCAANGEEQPESQQPVSAPEPAPGAAAAEPASPAAADGGAGAGPSDRILRTDAEEGLLDAFGSLGVSAPSRGAAVGPAPTAGQPALPTPQSLGSPALAEAAAPGEPASASAAQTGAPTNLALELPPDAAALALPDMRQLQGQLRSALTQMGFELALCDTAPATSPAVPQAERTVL